MRVLILILLLFTGCVRAQLYSIKTSEWDIYLELFADSAHSEVFKTHCHHWCTTRCIHNELLLPKRSGDTIFSGKNTHVLKKKEAIILCYKKERKKSYADLQMAKAVFDHRDSLRRFSQYYFRTVQLEHLIDSLNGPMNRIQLNPRRMIDRHKLLAYTFYPNSKMVADELDSLVAEVARNKDPEIDSYYRKIDSLKFIDSTTAFGLLANTNYQLSCGKYLIRQMARERPEFLIKYIDKSPANTQAILETVKDHNEFKEITSNVRSCNINSPGKKVIVKQRSKRIQSNIVNGFIVTGYILWELAVIGLLVLLFTKI